PFHPAHRVGLRRASRRAQQAELHPRRLHTARRRQRHGRGPGRRRGGGAPCRAAACRWSHTGQPGADPAVGRARVRRHGRPRVPDAAPARGLEHERGHRAAACLRAEGASARRGAEAPMAAGLESRAGPARGLHRRRRALAGGVPTRMSFTTKDGRKLTYRKLRHGPVLVCHPGGPGFSSSEFADLAALWEQFTLIMLNPRGTAGSERPRDRRAYQIDDYVEDLEDLRRHLGLERMLLLGFSHGGVVAMAYAAAYPGRVRKLVFASTLARFGPAHETAMRSGIEKRATQPWAKDAAAALQEEQEGEFNT